jgi:hypothetical protein
MVERKRVYRKKITVAIDLLGSLTGEEELDRDSAVAALKNSYEKTRLSPFRGSAFPEDIYDKEMATLYVVGKYGMGIDNDFPELFEKIFGKEKVYEKALEILLSDADAEEKRSRIESLLGREPDSNEIARILRIIFTKIVLGFDDEERIVRALHEAIKAFPEHENDIKKYARFYIGFRIAEMIATGEIRSKVDKEARKQALNLKMGLGKVMPDDAYIYNIARNVFKVPKQKLIGILQPRRRQKSEAGKGSRRQ